MIRIILKDTRESMTDWTSLEEVRAWAAENGFPLREQNGVLVVDATVWDDDPGGKAPALLEYRAAEFEDIGNGCLREVGPTRGTDGKAS